ncbi:MAG TPA: hypothetical protein VMM60_15490 [Ilumatobacter sp.]|nr:hypothetical protein [Ilumatobacter sp.]
MSDDYDTTDERDDLAGLDDDQLAEIEAQINDSNARIAAAPAEVVVTNHVMGLFQLGAIHLGSNPPDLRSASLAIDAMGFLVDGLGDRIGDEIDTMRDALANIRMAYVSVSAPATGRSDGD